MNIIKTLEKLQLRMKQKKESEKNELSKEKDYQ